MADDPNYLGRVSIEGSNLATPLPGLAFSFEAHRSEDMLVLNLVERNGWNPIDPGEGVTGERVIGQFRIEPESLARTLDALRVYTDILNRTGTPRDRLSRLEAPGTGDLQLGPNDPETPS